MKKITKAIAVLLTIVMLMQPVAFAASVTDFLDFPNNDWSTEAMTAAVENGLLNGDNNLIYPNDSLTRAELAAFITRAFGATREADISRLTDVSPEDWFYTSVARAYQMGALTGTSETTFSPDAYITREEVFLVLARVLCISGTDESVLGKFSDSAKISSWARNAIIGLVANGYINGYPDNTFRPQENITRAELAQVFHNIFKTYIDVPGYHTGALPNGSVMVRSSDVHLESTVINGDLIIADGVGAGNFDLSSVTVNGRILARGGEGTVTFKNVTVSGDVVIYDQNGTVNFNNYRTDAPFKNLNEITPATFLTKPVTPSGGGGSSSSGGGSSAVYYTVTYYVDGAVYATRSVRSGKTTVAVPAPDKEGYTFKRWATEPDGDTEFDFTKPITAPRSLYAVYEINTYTVTIKDANGNIIATVDGVEHNATLPSDKIPAAPTAPTGEEFAGWSADGGATIVDIATYPIAADTVLTPVFKPIKYTVSFEDGAGNVLASEEVNHGTVVSRVPNAPEPPHGQSFAGWSPDGGTTIVDVATYPVTANTVFTPVYTNKAVHTVTFKVGTTQHQQNLVIDGETATAPTSEPTLTGYTFLYWSLTENGSAFDFSTAITENIVLYAVFEIKTYTVTFKDADGNTYATVPNVTYNTTVPADKIPAAPQAPENKKFIGWSVNGGVSTVDLSTYRITGETVLTPVFVDEDTYTVTFMAAGSQYSQILVYAGNKATAPTPAPTLTGHTFLHWSLTEGGSAFDFTTAITEDTVLYAVFEINTYTVTFKDANGNTHATVTNVTYNTPVPADKIPAAPTAPMGKEFAGWSVDGGTTPVDVATYPIADDTVFTPVFTDKALFTVTFMANGTVYSTLNVIDGEKATAPATNPTKDGYTFLHWSLTEDGSAFDFATAITANTVLYAVFTANPVYVVTFYVDGAVYDTRNVEVGKTIGTLPADPVVAHKEFGGWYTGENGTGDAVTAETKVLAALDVYAYLTPELLTVNFYNIGYYDPLLATVQVPYNTCLNAGDIPALSETNGFERNSSLSTVYEALGIDYVHTVSNGWWIVSDGEWKTFDVTAPVTENVDVYDNSKWVTLRVSVPQLSSMPLTLTFPYNNSVRAIDTLKDAVFYNQPTAVTALKSMDDKLFEQMEERGVIDGEQNIKNFHRYVKLVNVIGKKNIEKYIWEFVKDSVQEDEELKDWVHDHLSNIAGNEATIAQAMKTAFNEILKSSNSEALSDELKAVASDMFISDPDLFRTYLIKYIDSKIAAGASGKSEIQTLVNDVLSEMKDEDEATLKSLIVDLITTQVKQGNEQFRSLLSEYIRDHINNYQTELVDYIDNKVSDAQFKEVATAVADADFAVVSSSIKAMLASDKDFAKLILGTLLDNENPALMAFLRSKNPYVDSMTPEQLKAALEQLIDDASEADMNDLADIAFAEIETDSELRSTAIDEYLDSVLASAAKKESLIEDLVAEFCTSETIKNHPKVQPIIESSIRDMLDDIDSHLTTINAFVQTLVDADNYDDITDIFVNSEKSVRDEIINTICDNLSNELISRITAMMVNKIFEAGELDDAFVTEMVTYFAAPENATRLDGVINTVITSLDGDTLAAIAAQLGHDGTSQKVNAINELIRELCEEEQVTVNYDNLFMFDPILDALEKYDFAFVESKIPEKLKPYLPMADIEDLFNRFYLGYINEMKQAMADAQADPTGTYYVASGVQIDLNPVADLIVPMLNYAKDMKTVAEQKLADRKPEAYNDYYLANPYLQAIDEFLNIEKWLMPVPGADTDDYLGELSGYKLRSVEEYYDLMKAMLVITDDAMSWYYDENNVPLDTREEVLDAAESKVLAVLNMINGFLVDYAVNGIPTNLTEFIASIESDPTMLAYLQKFGVDAYLDKLEDNATAGKVFNTALEKLEARFGARIEALLDRYADSRLNREYGTEEYEKAKKLIHSLFTTDEDDLLDVDDVFDNLLGGVTSKEAEINGITIELLREFYFSVDELNA